MINYKFKLPSFNILDRYNGQYNNPEVVLPSMLSSLDFNMGEFLHILYNTVHDARRLIFIDGKCMPVVYNWVRDAVHMMKAAKHYEYRLKDFLEFIMDRQNKEGFYYEVIKQYDDLHHAFVNNDCKVFYDDDNLTLVRLELEADVEYLMVEGVLQYYKSSGDIKFVEKYLPSLEKAINYMISSPKRYSKQYGLVIRPYTIDTWDFTNESRSNTDRRIHDDETMCAMHGDNSGVYAAMITLASFNKMLGKNNIQYWLTKAEELKKNIFKYLWNGRFFIHQFIIKGQALDNLENERLSMSNTYDINRGLTNFEQFSSIIEEYIKRKKKTGAILEFFAIDPPYQKFNKYLPEQYVNGAVSPFVAGELALASFNNGYSEYGYGIINRMMELVLKEKTISFLYNRKLNKKENTSGPSAWGCAAFINAIDEGLMGIVDNNCLYKDITFSPKLAITDFEEIRYFTGYEQSNIFLDIRYTHNEQGIRYDLYAKDVRHMKCRILVPRKKTISKVIVNEKEIAFKEVVIKNDKFIIFENSHKNHTQIEIYYK